MKYKVTDNIIYLSEDAVFGLVFPTETGPVKVNYMIALNTIFYER